MEIFVANFTKHAIEEGQIKKVVSHHLASKLRPRIIKISVVFLPPKRMQQINRHYRGKDYTPDVLTLEQPLNEILICPEQAGKNKHSIEFLIKHGINHLIGTSH